MQLTQKSASFAHNQTTRTPREHISLKQILAEGQAQWDPIKNHLLCSTMDVDTCAQ